jgi:hypothetical protein
VQAAAIAAKNEQVVYQRDENPDAWNQAGEPHHAVTCAHERGECRHQLIRHVDDADPDDAFADGLAVLGQPIAMDDDEHDHGSGRYSKRRDVRRRVTCENAVPIAAEDHQRHHHERRDDAVDDCRCEAQSSRCQAGDGCRGSSRTSAFGGA